MNFTKSVKMTLCTGCLAASLWGQPVAAQAVAHPQVLTAETSVADNGTYLDGRLLTVAC